MSDPISLGAARAEREGDNRLISPVETLREAIANIESGAVPANAVIVLALNTADGAYAVRWFASNLRSSEMIALMEVAKVSLLRDMGFT